MDVYAILQVLSNFYKSGCTSTFDDIHGDLLKCFRMNPDALAHLADVLVDCGCIDLAFPILISLANIRYNIPAVLTNLAIVSYMLGRPRQARSFAQMYEKSIGRRLALSVSLKIALGEVSRFRVRN